MMFFRLLGPLRCAAPLAMAATANAAILIDNYTSAANDRFQNSDTPDQFIS